VENSAMKQHGYVPTPKDGLDQVPEKIKARVDQHNRIKRMTVTKNRVSQPINEEDTDNSIAELAHYAGDFLMGQHEALNKFDCYHISDTECHVRFQRADTRPLDCGESIIC
jgi:hypothetical protein